MPPLCFSLGHEITHNIIKVPQLLQIKSLLFDVDVQAVFLLLKCLFSVFLTKIENDLKAANKAMHFVQVQKYLQLLVCFCFLISHL